MMSQRFASLLLPVQSKLQAVGPSADLLKTLLSWDGNMARTRTQPVAVSTWVDAVLTGFVQQVVPPALAPAVAPMIHTTIFFKTVYHHLADQIASDDPSPAIALLQAALDNAAKELSGYGVTPPVWGDVNRLSFSNPLDGLMPAPAIPDSPRDGYWETVDVSGPGFGPNFRMIASLKAGAPITAEIAVPGGNYDISTAAGVTGMTAELGRWLDGTYRELVPFVQ
jgi:acyl-homoserine lactone acylase PvdQ